MSRYFLVLDYDGTAYSGWQNQNNARTVQGEIEKMLSLILQEEISIIGCGRTDSGVHARNYHAHFDYLKPIAIDLKYKLNKMLDDDIAIKRFYDVGSDFHARYSARKRTYKFYLHGNKSAFISRHSLHYHNLENLDWDAIEQVSSLLTTYKEFYPFCKSKSDAKNMICELTKVLWTYDRLENTAVLEISSNRFLRGMVRLIVGMCLNIGESKLSLNEVAYALDKQQLLPKSHSVPAAGLFLHNIEYLK